MLCLKSQLQVRVRLLREDISLSDGKGKDQVSVCDEDTFWISTCVECRSGKGAEGDTRDLEQDGSTTTADFHRPKRL